MSAAELVANHLPLVRQLIVQRWGRVARPDDIDDLCQAGVIGLMDAAKRFDPSRGFQFRTFAHLRILGAAVDQLRVQLGRNDGRNKPRPQTALETDIMPLDSIVGSSQVPEWRAGEVRESVFWRLRAVFTGRIAQMALLHCFDGWTLREVAEVFSITESRCSQILAPIRKRVEGLIEQEVAA